MSDLSELEALYLEVVEKLAGLTAILGVPGDESAAVIEAHARKLMENRRQLLEAGAEVMRGAKPDLEGACRVPNAAIERLEKAIEQGNKL